MSDHPGWPFIVFVLALVLLALGADGDSAFFGALILCGLVYGAWVAYDSARVALGRRRRHLH